MCIRDRYYFVPNGKDEGPFRGLKWENHVNDDLSRWFLNDIDVEEIRIKDRDNNIELSAWWISKNYPKEKKTVIIVHGINASKKHFTQLIPASILANAGLNVLLFDQRNHGESSCPTGRYFAGTKEWEDINTVVNWLIEKKDILSKVYDHLNEEIIKIPNIDNYPLIGRTRASVKIQEGCDQVCSYCIIPYVRGREKSVGPETIINQINNAYKNDIKEVVLTGTQLGNYGFDLENINLKGLIRKVLNETNMERIRVSSLQPKEIDQELIDIWKYESQGRLCPHFHLPLQSGSNVILKNIGSTEKIIDALIAD